jgi:hypothetical protein
MLTILRMREEVHFFSRPSLESPLDVLKSGDQGKIYLIGTAGGNCSEGVPVACGLAAVRVMSRSMAP